MLGPADSTDIFLLTNSICNGWPSRPVWRQVPANGDVRILSVNEEEQATTGAPASRWTTLPSLARQGRGWRCRTPRGRRSPGSGWAGSLWVSRAMSLLSRFVMTVGIGVVCRGHALDTGKNNIIGEVRHQQKVNKEGKKCLSPYFTGHPLEKEER